MTGMAQISGTLIGTIAAVAIILALITIVVRIYNRLVNLRNRFKNAFSQIDVQLKRRYDLIPNLVETAKAYMKHEAETLEAVIHARNQAVAAQGKASAAPDDAGAVKGLLAADNLLTGAMTRFMALAEAYPDLKANQNMAQLSEELTSTENRIAFARQAYNDSATQYNTATEQFPAVMVAGMLSFRAAQLWEVQDQAQKETPKVSF